MTEGEKEAGIAALKKRWGTPANHNRDLFIVKDRIAAFLAGIDDRIDLLFHLTHVTMYRMATEDTTISAEQAADRTIAQHMELRRQGCTLYKKGDKAPLPSNQHLVQLM